MSDAQVTAGIFILLEALKEYGIAPSIQHLTESQGRAVLGFRSFDAFRSSIVAARQARGD